MVHSRSALPCTAIQLRSVDKSQSRGRRGVQLGVELPVQVIDLGDEMEFERLPGASKDELTCNVADVPTDGSNLVIKVGVFVLVL